MKKTFVLDTSVLLHDANCIFKFEEHSVIIPITSIEEMDTFKKDQREIGRNARQIARHLKDLMEKGSLSDGVTTNEKGGTLRIVLDSEYEWKLGVNFSKDINDNKILNCAAACNGILVSNDINLRVKAASCGLESEDYYNDKIDYDDMYTGVGILDVQGGTVDRIHAQGVLPIDGNVPMAPNQCFLMRDSCNYKHSALVRYNANTKEFKKIPDITLMDISPRNMEQHMALDLLLDPNIKLVTLVGLAGCGKSLMALLAGMHQVLETKTYKKLLVYRPIVPMGNDIGYLPGTMEEKLLPWMQPISDNIDFIIGSLPEAEIAPKTKSKTNNKSSKAIQQLQNSFNEKDAGRISATSELQEMGLLEMGALTYIRGRSIPDQFIIIDEAQNCSIHEIKTIITRVGEGTKIILTGDPSQIDTPYLDSSNNGLTFIAERFKDQNIAGHIVFTKSERSELAEIAANIL